MAGRKRRKRTQDEDTSTGAVVADTVPAATPGKSYPEVIAQLASLAQQRRQPCESHAEAVAFSGGGTGAGVPKVVDDLAALVPLVESLPLKRKLDAQLLGPDELVEFVQAADDAVVLTGVPPTSMSSVLVQKGKSKRRTTHLSISEHVVHAYLMPAWPFRAVFKTKASLIVVLANVGYAFGSMPTALHPYSTTASELLASLDAQQLQPFLVELLEDQIPLHYYSGSLVVEIRDFRHKQLPDAPSASDVSTLLAGEPYAVHKVLLEPNYESLMYDLERIHVEQFGGGWTRDERILLEKRLLHALHPPVCLDPSLRVAQVANCVAYNTHKFTVRPDPSIDVLIAKYDLFKTLADVITHTATKFNLLSFLTEQRRHGKPITSLQGDPMSPLHVAPHNASLAKPTTLAALAAAPPPTRKSPLYSAAPPSFDQAIRPYRGVKFAAVKENSKQCSLAIYNTAESIYTARLQFAAERYVAQIQRLFEKEGFVCIENRLYAPPKLPTDAPPHAAAESTNPHYTYFRHPAAH
ncbi:uncharacterized protein AMSG_04126 [Thecamonas trahens ATCC 50062]|uniref:Spt20-like SEP domain-containing protein n=1 Tax=Thecamonas trahens ATCC 50062 TaxID=461836 RepID=A0A0L0D6R7_THETB|nr:hypothetical protein AMSG_04126 [Thecamonas trahens ATCC 50062]KNC47895.1 hypothetical protein AMSG_04126 [Thecamonas trahens ATCC 50062]|eukprot:XP_013758917.1 hypothetical protein AMSG_04126 [Thecamonas trahens ATCC 50062]